MAPTEEDVTADTEVQIEEEEEEETQAPRVAHDPAQPTERQLSEHRATHTCLTGRGASGASSDEDVASSIGVDRHPHCR